MPQLDEVSAGLGPLSGFRLHPAAGLVPLDVFYGSLADGVFHSTQYLRHPSQPLYTPEPDILHEVVGHCNLLANPAIAEVKRRAGEAARRCETPEGLQYVADVFWFTIEFGVMYEDGELRAYGAGLLSSYGEIEEFRGADIRPVDFDQMATLAYDISHYQPILFACDGMGELTDRVAAFFADFDDERGGPARPRGPSPPTSGDRLPVPHEQVLPEERRELVRGVQRQDGRDVLVGPHDDDAARRGRCRAARRCPRPGGSRRPSRSRRARTGRCAGRKSSGTAATSTSSCRCW